MAIPESYVKAVYEDINAGPKRTTLKHFSPLPLINDYNIFILQVQAYV